MRQVVIVNLGISNLDSIRRGIEECGASALVTKEPAAVRSADRIILPGVGSYVAAMRALHETGVGDALREVAADGRVPVLGICLGMQLMVTEGFEFGGAKGLDLIKGSCVALQPVTSGEYVPHIGWNSVDPAPNASLFKGIDPGTDFYFVHSYHVKVADEADIAAKVSSYGGFVAALSKGPLQGVQFHPEKSQRHGLKLLSNFLAL